MRQVAELLGVKENTYRVWEDENGSCPKPHFIVELAKIYKVSTDALFYGLKAEGSTPLAVNSPQKPYNDIYGDRYFTELSDSEKILVMSVRRLNSEDRQQVMKYIAELQKNNQSHY